MGETLKSVLVTGAAGLLGRSVIAELRSRGLAVTALDLQEPAGAEPDRVVLGNADDIEAVRDALSGIDAVIHLAARRSPRLGTAQQVFCGNTSATFNVLEQAGAAGVRRAVIASSYSVTGLPFAGSVRHPGYLPIDEHLPAQIEDPYALSKKVDELSSELMWWRHRLSVVAIRFPFLGRLDSELPERAARIADDPSFAATEFWAYLETRDAATACVQGLLEPPPGHHVVCIAAPNTLAPYPTEELLDRYHPDVQRRTVFPDRSAPINASKAEALLKWSAKHLWDCPPRQLASHAG